jgi:hypothetical protein
MDDFAVDSEYHYLLDDSDFRRFIQNVRRRSETSASELLRRFGMIHKRFRKLPKDSAKMDTKQAKRFLLDMIEGGSGCRHLLDDLNMRSQPISSKEQVVTGRAFAEADRILRAAKVRWFELRHYFHQSCEWVEQQYPALRHEAIHFMLGYVVKEDDLTHVQYFFDPKTIGCLRQGYVEVEKVSFQTD